MQEGAVFYGPAYVDPNPIDPRATRSKLPVLYSCLPRLLLKADLWFWRLFCFIFRVAVHVIHHAATRVPAGFERKDESRSEEAGDEKEGRLKGGMEERRKVRK